jgi:uncharacterized ferredoxin-like protein
MTPKAELRMVAALEKLASAMESLAETSKKRLNKDYPVVRKKDAQVFSVNEEHEDETAEGRYERLFKEATKG